jgi:hypothetical protein
MNSLYGELSDFALFLKAVLEVGFYTGFPVVLAVLLAYEKLSKRRI